MITVKELAKMCDVSPSTVSNILNGKTNVSQQTRERVLKAVQETGYQPNYFAASMRKQNTRMIAIIVEDLDNFSTIPIVESAMAYCDDHDYRTMLVNLRLYDKWKATWFNDEEKIKSMLLPALNEVQSIKVDGIIYVAGHGRTFNCFPKDFSIPTMIAYASSENERFPSIILDDEKGGYDMIEYLVSMGHRKIGIIAGMPDNIHTVNRLIGCQRALYEEDIPYNPAWTVYGDWEKTSGYACAEELFKTDVTAIWCMNDLMAGGAFEYAHSHKIEIGKDISIAGYDDRANAEYMYPALTTSALPLKEIGRKSAETILSLLQGMEVPMEPIKVPCNMVIRDSVRKLD